MIKLLKKTSRLFHTIKYLKFEQVYYRGLYKIKAPKVTDLNVHSRNIWYWKGPNVHSQSIFGNDEFLFLSNKEFVNLPRDWNSLKYEKLWLYNLHYFDDLNSVNYDERESLHYFYIDNWIECNPACIGVGWEPYPTSLRLVNWIKWFSRKKTINKKYLVSIAQQGSALAQHLEYHLLGNHLFANAKALTFLGTFLQGSAADKFLKLGLKLLDREIKEQFLLDGGHFELSPMYHKILLWDLLELIDLAKTSKNKELLKRLERWEIVARSALYWLQTMIHPDGEISFFNDSAFGVAASPEEIFNYADSLKLGALKALPLFVMNKNSGYSRVQNNNYTIIFDHGAIGPDYLPGHAHADSLSFEMSLGSERLFVNSGTSIYGATRERLRQRKTAAHNTVVVNDEDSSEVWGGFRVARRAYTEVDKVEVSNCNVSISAKHNGYTRLKPKITHTRTLVSNKDDLLIIDSLSNIADGEFHLHLHPDVKIYNSSRQRVVMLMSSGRKVSLSASSNLYIEESTWHPEFGVSVTSKKIIIPFENMHLESTIRIIND